MTRRPPLPVVWWTHLALGLFSGGVTGALSMLWFGAMSIPFDPDGPTGLSWIPLFSVYAGVVGACVAAIMAITIGTAFWVVKRIDLGQRWYPVIGSTSTFAVMFAWSTELRLVGRVLVALMAAWIAWRLIRATEEIFSDYRAEPAPPRD